MEHREATIVVWRDAERGVCLGRNQSGRAASRWRGTERLRSEKRVQENERRVDLFGVFDEEL